VIPWARRCSSAGWLERTCAGGRCTELYAAVQGAGPRGTPPAWWLLAMVLGMLLAAVGLTAIPARAGTRRPTAEILQAETA